MNYVSLKAQIPIQLEDLEEPESTSKQNTLLEIYDILLAGVDTDGN